MCSQLKEGAERDRSRALSFPGRSSVAIMEAAGAHPHSRYFLRFTFLGLGHGVEGGFKSSTRLLSFSHTSWYRMGNWAELVGGGRSADWGEPWSIDWVLPGWDPLLVHVPSPSQASGSSSSISIIRHMSWVSSLYSNWVVSRGFALD